MFFKDCGFTLAVDTRAASPLCLSPAFGKQWVSGRRVSKGSRMLFSAVCSVSIHKVPHGNRSETVQSSQRSCVL